MQQRNLALSRYLSPAEAVQWLQERNYKTSYRAVSEMMRSGAIESIEKDDYAVNKRPRVVTTEAALEIWLEAKFKAAKRRNITTKMQAAMERNIQEKVETAMIPTKWELKLEETLNINSVDSYVDAVAGNVLDERLRLQELRRERREQKKRENSQPKKKGNDAK